MATIFPRNKSINVRIRRKGFREVNATFDNTPEGKEKAKDFAQEIERKMKRGVYVDNNEGKTTSLADALIRYSVEITPSKKGAKQEHNRIAAMSKLPYAQFALADIRSTDIARIRDEMVKDGYAPSSIKNTLSIISQVYNTAITEWGITEINNPVIKIKRPKANAGRERRLRHGEEEMLLETLYEPFRSMFILSLETAARRSELCSLKWENINLKQRFAILRDTKNGSKRTIPLSTRAIEVLNGMVRNLDGFVFGGVKADSYSHAFLRACRACNIEGLKVHDLRHEATSRLFELGTLGVMEVASITGHKDLRMLKRYTHLDASELAKKLG